MRKAIKLWGKIAPAYELGKNSAVEQDLIRLGKIRILPDGRYELFSRESVNGSGEIAQAGDFFKVDSCGFPYPNRRDFFLANHRHLEDDLYEQMPKPLEAWQVSDGMCDEIRYLIEKKGLVLNADMPDRYFTAPLWGTMESAAQDAVVVFYEITRDSAGCIADVSFNFVAYDEFLQTYEWV